MIFNFQRKMLYDKKNTINGNCLLKCTHTFSELLLLPANRHLNFQRKNVYLLIVNCSILNFFTIVIIKKIKITQFTMSYS